MARANHTENQRCRRRRVYHSRRIGHIRTILLELEEQLGSPLARHVSIYSNFKISRFKTGSLQSASDSICTRPSAHELMTRKQIIRPQSVRSSSTSSEDSPGPLDRKDPSLASDLPFQRTLPPWIPKHDIPRGVLYAGQAVLTYLLMLAVM